MKLNEIKPKNRVKIVEINLTHSVCNRLYNMGFVPKNDIIVLKNDKNGGAFCVDNIIFCVESNITKHIVVEYEKGIFDR